MTTSTRAPADGLEHRLAAARIHLTRIATFIAGPNADNALLAGAHDSIASLATATACELRDEDPLR